MLRLVTEYRALLQETWDEYLGHQARAACGRCALTGKQAYDRAIDGAPEFIDPPELQVVRMVEQGDVVMAELTGTARRTTGGAMRMSMAEVFVMRDGKIAERRAWVIPLNENDYR